MAASVEQANKSKHSPYLYGAVNSRAVVAKLLRLYSTYLSIHVFMMAQDKISQDNNAAVPDRDIDSLLERLAELLVIIWFEEKNRHIHSPDLEDTKA